MPLAAAGLARAYESKGETLEGMRRESLRRTMVG